MSNLAYRDQALAFRLDGHHLARPLPSGSLLEAAGACAVQNSPPGSAELALHARVGDLAPAGIQRALEEDKTLLQLWSIPPHYFPTQDAPVFTTGLLPEDEEGWLFVVQGFTNILKQVEMSATEAVELAAAALHEALDGRVLTKREMGAELGKRLPKKLRPWMEPDEFSNFGAVLVRPIGLQGLFCLAPREGNEASFVRTDQWLGRPPPTMEPPQAQAELVRRYLRCYGPSTAAHFAEWAGIAPHQAEHAWQRLADDLVEVSFAGQQTWLHRDDLPRFNAPSAATGIRLLPPHEPYLHQRDRETLLPDKALQRQVWRTSGNPGVVLANGEIVAVWRPQKKGKRLLLTVTPFTRLSRPVQGEIAAVAEGLAPYRGCASAEVTLAKD
ncbi:MAG: winged helix DNA-binding domain-containing protein [Chloroflexi bacterium]|nr:winged helix DNA-binding domain-containing protein [Chloroflexota bacterium]MCI0577717.1 winged helix DNA-binding domain-containing protein [Chloroflexota bacterium]MCI0649800.1 winged helix DNA-binding domain-containing protein [Chloroflexota bacterium]MCI0730509.1 winged helix DNA-binding domain-containing protein [Chloroflexota bacterium]